jgi:phospholipase C
MDVQQGQAFIRQVVGLFIKHGLLQRTLFAITYDEHGGFFDHIAPPGTVAAVNAGSNYGKVENLFPQDPKGAPKYLGVRVPSLVLSKWTAARANHTVLDHTAILKTILLHNRDRISTDQFGRFGKRVKKRGHLGQVLGLPSPRSIDYVAVAADIGYDGTTPSATNACVSARSVGMTLTHPANVMRGIAVPRGRTLVV